jgi:hypothetical protein
MKPFFFNILSAMKKFWSVFGLMPKSFTSSGILGVPPIASTSYEDII